MSKTPLEHYHGAFAAIAQAQQDNGRAVSTALSILKSLCQRFQSTAQSISEIDHTLPMPANVPSSGVSFASLFHDLFTEFRKIPTLNSIVESDLLPRVGLAHTAYSALKAVSPRAAQAALKRVDVAIANRDQTHAKYERACKQIESVHAKAETNPKLNAEVPILVMGLRAIRANAIAGLDELNAARQEVHLQFERMLHDFEKVEQHLNEEIGKAIFDLSDSLATLVSNYELLATRLHGGIGGLSSQLEVEQGATLGEHADTPISVDFDVPVLNFDVTKVAGVDLDALFGDDLRMQSATIAGVDGIVTVIGEHDGALTLRLLDGSTTIKPAEEVEIVFRRKLVTVTEDSEPVVAGETVLVIGVDEDLASCQTVFGLAFRIPASKLSRL
jgi:hypothetical protein